MYNKFNIWVLRSPLHGMMDKSTMLVTVTGRKSGKKITTPVNYVREGDVLWVTSTRERNWWKNLRGGSPLSVCLGGMDRYASGEVFESEEGVVEGLRAYFKAAPQVAKYFQVKLDEGGHPDEADIARAATERVVVRIKLD